MSQFLKKYFLTQTTDKEEIFPVLSEILFARSRQRWLPIAHFEVGNFDWHILMCSLFFAITNSLLAFPSFSAVSVDTDCHWQSCSFALWIINSLKYSCFATMKIIEWEEPHQNSNKIWWAHSTVCTGLWKFLCDLKLSHYPGNGCWKNWFFNVSCTKHQPFLPYDAQFPIKSLIDWKMSQKNDRALRRFFLFCFSAAHLFLFSWVLLCCIAAKVSKRLKLILILKSFQITLYILCCNFMLRLKR